MAYYVRKIARAKWSLLDKDSENIIDNYNADTIANDMRTQANTLSLWRVESLSDEDIEPAIVINSLLGDTISKIDLMFIPEELMSNYSLVQKNGNTVVTNYAQLHYDVEKLTVKKHVLFAKDIVLKIFALEEANAKAQERECPNLIRRISETTQLDMIIRWIDRGEIVFEELKAKQQEAVRKWRAKKSKAS